MQLEVFNRASRSKSVLDLTPDARPVADLQKLARLLSGRQIEDLAGAVPAGFSEQQTAWLTLKGKWPELPGSPSVPADRWHAHEAMEAERYGRWHAAVVHLDPLVAASPGDSALLRRRAEALARIGRFDRAAEDFGRVRGGDLFHPDVRQAIAVLSAWCRDARAYQALSTTIFRSLPAVAFPARFISVGADLASPLVLAPVDAAWARELLALAERRLGASRDEPAPLAFRGAVRYRAGDVPGASRDLRDSVAAYGRKLRDLSRFTRVADPIVTDSTQVTPSCNEGTPREWVFLAMVEYRLGHVETARAWLVKTSHWLEMATRDPPDPAALGGLSDPGMRAILRMTRGVRMRPEMMGPGASRYLTEPYLGTWRQLLALRVLVREATALVSGEGDLPDDVFAHGSK